MSLPIMSTSEAERIAWMAGIWEEAAAFCAAARDGVDFASLTESTARQEGAFDMADHLTATFKQMAESARRREFLAEFPTLAEMRLREALIRIRNHCADNDSENWIWRTANQAITAAL
jgi:hypothetical protein